jgi:uncharacterized protein
VFLSKFSFGASFDCASPNVTRPAEKLICANADISKLDDTLVSVYNQTKSQLSEGAQTIFVNGQRSWLGYWPRFCSADGKGRIFDKKNGVECVKKAYKDRIEELKIKFLDRQYPYFEVVKYAALTPGKDVPDYATLVVHSQSYPQFELKGLAIEDATVANKMNTWIAGIIRRANINFNDADQEDAFVVSVSGASPDMVTATQASYINGFGAHPVSTASQSHFIKSKLKILTAADIFKGRDWINPISRQIFQALKKQSGDMLLINSPQELIPMISDPKYWSFSRTGMNFEFNVYEVAAYVAGPQDVAISWQTLMPYLTDYAKAEFSKPSESIRAK